MIESDPLPADVRLHALAEVLERREHLALAEQIARAAS